MPTRPSPTALSALFTAILAGGAPALAAPALVCLAPTYPTDAAKPLQDVETLEFYSDEGDPLRSYSVPFKRVQSDVDADGRTHNAYSVSTANAIGASIVFSNAGPMSFTVVELAKTYTSLGKNDEETTFLADAVPGVACYSVSIKGISF